MKDKGAKSDYNQTRTLQSVQMVFAQKDPLCGQPSLTPVLGGSMPATERALDTCKGSVTLHRNVRTGSDKSLNIN